MWDDMWIVYIFSLSLFLSLFFFFLSLLLFLVFRFSSYSAFFSFSIFNLGYILIYLPDLTYHLPLALLT